MKLQEEADKYETINEFKKSDRLAYDAARKRKIIDHLFTNKKSV